ncbi:MULTISPECIES: helix-turn-helix domain-containing protein [Microbacterium]|uniref:Helix-turn-helix domain-containing protein n=1 Tax=Microbacterium wangchenii TaxID=2541726 RepID=A0ABX5SMR8_9MICO|nr:MULTISPECIES: helix-turn-helix domain-containing protein [Microbacterium]MCK6066462.1 helix-turn-helix domain-containing protein [Microbacterium sp. EYE_512]QBR87420.1 helix-turn-helix domain-containing protein [Microbacterium wangchenii]TFV84469.1 helix-turn-helix domain-containing protein [Microbacterium sp. dk485]TXK14742.1 helix-turn-helix domain-containing protein [Microbacterium wangchenii]
MFTAKIASVQDLGFALQQSRMATGMTQRDLAQAVGTTQRYIWELESGKPAPALVRLLDALRETGAEITVSIPEGPATDG